MNDGYIALWRKLRENPLWGELLAGLIFVPLAKGCGLVLTGAEYARALRRGKWWRREAMARRAEAFLSWWRRLWAADRAGAFRRWAKSKDFAPRVARRIARAVERRTGQEG